MAQEEELSKDHKVSDEEHQSSIDILTLMPQDGESYQRHISARKSKMVEEFLIIYQDN